VPLLQLRKVCNHPYMFLTSGYSIDETIVRSSGKFELLNRMLPKLFAAKHRCVVQASVVCMHVVAYAPCLYRSVLMFTIMTQVMDVIEDFFNLRQYKFLRLDGSVRLRCTCC
jgi:SNF2 family DNA or RNA helicase